MKFEYYDFIILELPVDFSIFIFFFSFVIFFLPPLTLSSLSHFYIVLYIYFFKKILFILSHKRYLIIFQTLRLQKNLECIDCPESIQLVKYHKNLEKSYIMKLLLPKLNAVILL